MELVLKICFWILFGLPAFACFGYPALLCGLSRFYRRPARAKAVQARYDLVITAHNEQSVIEEKLENTLNQEKPGSEFSILLALDGCTDATEDLARRFGDRGVRLFVRKEHLGKTRTQPSAAETTQGDILIFSDANALLEEGALVNLTAPFADPRVECVCGSVHYRSAKSGTFLGEGLFKKYDQWLKTMESRIGSCVTVEGSLFAVRRRSYFRTPGYISEDLAIPLHVVQKGGRVVYEPRARSIERFDLDGPGQIKRRARIAVRNLEGYRKKTHFLNPVRYGFFSLQIVFHYLLPMAAPFFLLALLFLNVVLAGAGRFYAAMLSLQTIFYFSALIYPFIVKIEKEWPGHGLWRVPYFFILSNAGLLLGWYYFLTGRRLEKWEPERP